LNTFNQTMFITQVNNYTCPIIPVAFIGNNQPTALLPVALTPIFTAQRTCN